MKMVLIFLVGHTVENVLPGQKTVIEKFFQVDGETKLCNTDPRNQEDHAANCKNFTPSAVFLPSDIQTALPWLRTVRGTRHFVLSATDVLEVSICDADPAPILRHIAHADEFIIERLVPAGD